MHNFVRSNTRYVHCVVTPSAAWQLNHRLHPQRSIKGSAETTLQTEREREWGSRYYTVRGQEYMDGTLYGQNYDNYGLVNSSINN